MIDKSWPHLLVVGGTGRNVGKTEFVCRLIAQISALHTVYGLKISVQMPDEMVHHGDHRVDPSSTLYEETNAQTDKDTARMLRAGARRVFYLHGTTALIEHGWQSFAGLLEPGALIVCESNALATYVRPGLSIMVKAPGTSIKPRALERLAAADLVVVSDGTSGFGELARIGVGSGPAWVLHPL